MPRRTNILVVDGDAARRKTLSASLRGIGYRVTAATTGQGATALFGKKPFNIVLADIKLPDASGRQILETAKEFNPEVAVIMMTNRANLEAAMDTVSEGAYAYILKPEATDELNTLINNALREQELSLRNRKLVESLQQSNKLFSEANEKLKKEITERKRMEREIQSMNEQLEAQNKELEKASRAKSDFLARMSHELRTPLNVVMGFAELMLDGVPGKINDEQRQCLDDILTSGQHLLGLINEVLDLTKVEAGKVELRREDIALAEVVESVTSAMTAVLSQRKQSLDVSLDDGLPLVQADEARLRQVFFNLLSNASKFTPDGGRLRIEASANDGWCQVSVSDNGIGIKEEDLRQIFEPFYQADNLETRERRGTGLGLTLVKEIVEMHGGQISVESKYGKGSSFIFTLPLVAAKKTRVKENTGSRR
jgi:signal transduction histidine kinase